MHNIFNIQEIAIAIIAEDLNPTVFNVDFLRYSNIIPTDWKLARSPVYTNRLAQLLFSNGIALVAQPNKLMLAEAVGAKPLHEVQLAEIASRCIETLSQVKYQAIGINPTGFVVCESAAEAHQYICQTLLSPGAWQAFGEAQMNASLRLTYSLERGQLNVEINQAVLNAAEQAIPAILFAGNFNYAITGETQPERLDNLQQVIRNWQEDLETYRQLIQNKFLRSGDDKDEKPQIILKMVNS